MKTKIHTVYKDKKGNRLPSVTSILNVLSKPALIHWAWQMGCDGKDYRKERDEKGEIGSLAHYLIMCFFKMVEPDLKDYTPNQIDQAETCVIKFYDWIKQYVIKQIFVEEPMTDEINGFGGTPDLVCTINDELTLIDFKTAKAIYSDNFYQLAAYKRLVELRTENTIKKCRILRIGRDGSEGFEERVVEDLTNEWLVFLNCLNIYNLRKELKK